MILSRSNFLRMLCVGAAAGLSSCGRKANSATPLTPVSLRLSWIINTGAAGYLWALDHGMYRDQGLDVRVNAGGAAADAIQLVAAGSDTVGIADAAKFLIARDRSAAPLRAIAAEFQESPFCYVAPKSSGIASVKDFKGKRIGTQVYQLFVLEAMLAANGMKLADVINVPVQTDMRPLLEHQVDAILTFVTGGPVILGLQGIPTNVIKAADNGYRFYSNVLFASESVLGTQRDLLIRFLRASARGWQAAGEHVDQAVDLIIKHNPTQDPDLQRRSLITLRDFAMPPDGHSHFGQMQRERWQESIDLLVKWKQIERPMIADQVFTTELMDAAYARL